ENACPQAGPSSCTRSKKRFRVGVPVAAGMPARDHLTRRTPELACKTRPAVLQTRPMKQLDHSLSAHIHGWRLGPLDYLLVVPGMLFGSYVMPLTVLALGLWLGWRFGLVCVMAALTTVAITGPLKHWIGRERPAPLEAPRAFKLRKLVNNPSFPSGDSAQAGA